MTAPELVAPGVYRVDAIGPKNLLNVLLLENDDGWTLVDTGVPNSVERIKGAITSLGSGPGETSSASSSPTSTATTRAA